MYCNIIYVYISRRPRYLCPFVVHMFPVFQWRIHVPTNIIETEGCARDSLHPAQPSGNCATSSCWRRSCSVLQIHPERVRGAPLPSERPPPRAWVRDLINQKSSIFHWFLKGFIVTSGYNENVAFSMVSVRFRFQLLPFGQG